MANEQQRSFAFDDEPQYKKPQLIDEDLQTTLSEDDEDDDEGGSSAEPFDPTKIRIEVRMPTIDLLVKRIENDEIDLRPDFQRNRGLWNDLRQSRLIESLLIRIPIPAFYIDASNEERWIVIDGLQRLSVFERFIVKKELKLTDLEFLTQYNGKRWDDLPRPMQRRIFETQVIVYQTQAGTPPEVRQNIFKRINTGGLPLSHQEIRHALNQGVPTDFLERCSNAPIFQETVTRYMKPERMKDREYILRFFAFRNDRWRTYDHSISKMDRFLTDYMSNLSQQTPEDLDVLFKLFVRAVRAGYKIFGEDAFRKRYKEGDGKKPINKALFESWTVNLDAVSDTELVLLIERSERVRKKFIELMNKDSFDTAISMATRDVSKIKLRFEAIETLIKEVLAQKE